VRRQLGTNVWTGRRLGKRRGLRGRMPKRSVRDMLTCIVAVLWPAAAEL
jgi:hypothetical protein